MIKSIFQICLVAILSILLLGSCKKMKPAKIVPSKESEEEKPPVVVPPKEKMMLPVKMTTTNLTVDFIYLENTALIIEIRLSTGVRYQVTYADKVLKKVQKFKDNINVQFVDYLVTDGRITRVSTFDIREKVTSPTGKYQLDYNTSTQINSIKTYAISNSLISEKKLEYDKYGNVLNYSLIAGISVNNYDYSYDLKKGVFSSVLFCQLLDMEISDAFLAPGLNNVLSLSNRKLSTENIEYEYVYGIEDYPANITINRNGIAQKLTVTYVELK
jgi:hypothetical protein